MVTICRACQRLGHGLGGVLGVWAPCARGSGGGGSCRPAAGLLQGPPGEGAGARRPRTGHSGSCVPAKETSITQPGSVAAFRGPRIHNKNKSLLLPQHQRLAASTQNCSWICHWHGGSRPAQAKVLKGCVNISLRCLELSSYDHVGTAFLKDQSPAAGGAYSTARLGIKLQCSTK